MSSLVPDFIINPVLRQARRLSANFATSAPETPLDKRSPLDAPAFHDDEESESEQKQDLSQGAGSSGSAAVRWPSDPARMAADPLTSGPAGAWPIATRRTLPRHFRAPALPEETQQQHQQGQDGMEAIPISSSAPDRQSPYVPRAMELANPSESRPIADDGHIEAVGDEDPEGGTPSSFPARFYGNMELPEDDGMSKMRRRILAVQSRDIAPTEKARMIHGLLMEGYTRARQFAQPARPLTPSSPPVAAATIRDEPVASGPLESLKFWHASHSSALPLPTQTFTLTEEDLRATYVPGSGKSGLLDGNAASAASGNVLCDVDGPPMLGCEHYRRNVKLQCFTCERWYTCRLCHNEAEDHTLPRRDTKNMLCMLCGHAQRVGDVCCKCGESAARYYCSICKLWNDDPDKSIYHCNDCGICRVGEGLGKDFFHCKKCGSCIAINQEESHRCREGVMDCDCPICGEYIFTTHKKVVTMKCGHMIHDDCRAEYIKRSYKCPICNKSVENMESMFRRLDKHLEEQPMPEEYQDTRAVILCNDCEAKTSTKYHWGGLRCEICLSYNTVELHLLNSPASHGEPTEPEGARSARLADTADALGRPTTFSLPLHVSTAHDTLLLPPMSQERQQQHRTSNLPSPPLSSSPQLGDPLPGALPTRAPGAGHSPRSPVMLFRSVSPVFMTQPLHAPVMATAPPGYSEQGFDVEGDDDDYLQTSDMEDANVFGLFDRRNLSWGRRATASEEDDDDDEDEDDEEEEEEEEDDFDDDDDEEEEIALFGHR